MQPLQCTRIFYSLEKLVYKETQPTKGMQIDMVTHKQIVHLNFG